MKTKSLSRRERERLRHRKEILAAAKTVFIECGYSAATMEAIATEAEFSLATVYKFFGSKENLFLEILLQMFENLEQLTDEVISGEGSIKEKTIELFKARMELFGDNPGLIALIEDVIKNNHADLPCLGDLKRRYVTYINRLMLFFSEGITSGDFKDRGSRTLALAFEGILHIHFYFGSYMGETERNRQEEANLLSFFMEGVSSTAHLQKAGD